MRLDGQQGGEDPGLPGPVLDPSEAGQPQRSDQEAVMARPDVDRRRRSERREEQREARHLLDVGPRRPEEQGQGPGQPEGQGREIGKQAERRRQEEAGRRVGIIMRLDRPDGLLLVGDVILKRIDQVRPALDDEPAAGPHVDEIPAPDVAGLHEHPAQIVDVDREQQHHRERAQHHDEQPQGRPTPPPRIHRGAAVPVRSFPAFPGCRRRHVGFIPHRLACPQ